MPFARRFEVIAASEPLHAKFGSTVGPLDAACAVVDLDTAEGRVAYSLEAVAVAQVAPADPSLPSFFVHRVEGRERRPRGAAKDPLSIEAARATGQHFVAFQSPVGPLLALANPFAYLPCCVTWSPTMPLKQLCGDGPGETEWQYVLSMMLFLCEELQDHVVGFNERLGNSLERLHVVSHVPPLGLGPYPVQQAFFGRRDSIAHAGRTVFPTNVWRLDAGDAEATASVAGRLMNAWRELAGPFASANVAAIVEDGRPVLYVTPRHRHLRAVGWKSPAFLELLGLFIASPEVFAQVEAGALRFDHFWQLLASLRIPASAAAHINDRLVS